MEIQTIIVLAEDAALAVAYSPIKNQETVLKEKQSPRKSLLHCFGNVNQTE